MTRNERILKTWNRVRNMAARNVYWGDRSFSAFMEPIDCLIVESTPNMEETTERILFTFEDVGYHHAEQGYYEWWNVICEGRIVAYFPYDSPHRENMI